MAGELGTDRGAGIHLHVVGKIGKLGVKERQERPEGIFVATVGGGGDEDQVAGLVRREPLEEFKASLPAASYAAGECAGVGLVDDHQLRAGTEKVVAVADALDVVGGNDHERMSFEQRLTRPEASFETLDGRGEDELRLDVKLLLELPLPLLGEVGRAENGKPCDLAPLEELLGDQGRFHRLADTDVVGDQEPDRLETQSHQQRHKLVRTRLDANLAE